jgi:hypothetical protein
LCWFAPGRPSERSPRTVREVPSSSSSSLVFPSSWFNPLRSWVLVARGLSDSPQASHGQFAGVGRSIFCGELREVRAEILDGRLGPCGQSAPSSQTVRLWFATLVKCFGLIYASARHYKNLVDTWRFALVIDRQKSVMVNYLWRFKNLLQNHHHNLAKSGKPSQMGCNYDTSNRHGPWDPWVSWQQAMTKWNVMGRFHVSAAMSVLWGGTWLPRHLADWAHLLYLAWAQIQPTTAAQYSFFGYWTMIHFARPTTA